MTDPSESDSFDVFICYPRTYLEQVTPLRSALETRLQNVLRRDARVYQDVEDREPGVPWRETVDAALSEAKVLLVIVIPTLLESKECRREILTFENENKPILPVVCEPLSNPVESLQDGGEGWDEIVKCRKILDRWENTDLTQTILLEPSESAYKTSIRNLALDVRTAILNGSQRRKKHQDKPIKPPSGDHGTPKGSTLQKVVAGALVAVLVGILVLIGSGQHCQFWQGVPLCEPPVPQLTAADAQRALTTHLAEATTKDALLEFEVADGTLTVQAPVYGETSLELDLSSLQDIFDRASVKVGFAVLGAGSACARLDGLKMRVGPLKDGEAIDLNLSIYPEADSATLQTCKDPKQSWQPLPYTKAFGVSGKFRDAPNDAAAVVGTIRSGSPIDGPFLAHPSLPEWIMVQVAGQQRFTERTNLDLR